MWAWANVVDCAGIIRVKVYNEVLPQEFGDCFLDTGKKFV